ncbi:unnamed protein product [Orchesella dallaii]|uniref:Cytosolic fatty-acid binding proteins domain-containing protein n=1 Tax=Orchesella dallaii TaxID=48710 RepID=A0ABP1QNQ3_9HEXA
MALTGKFELEKSENFDAYLKAVGVNFAKRAIASTMKPTIEISENNGVYTIKTFSVLKNTEITFTPDGSEFEEDTADGRKAKSSVTIEGNKLIHVQKIGDVTSTTVREFNGDKMTVVLTCQDVTSTREYKKTA